MTTLSHANAGLFAPSQHRRSCGASHRGLRLMTKTDVPGTFPYLVRAAPYLQSSCRSEPGGCRAEKQSRTRPLLVSRDQAHPSGFSLPLPNGEICITQQFFQHLPLPLPTPPPPDSGPSGEGQSPGSLSPTSCLSSQGSALTGLL